MYRIYTLLLFSVCVYVAQAQTTPYPIAFEDNDNYSATYQETIEYYQQLASDFPQLQLTTHGNTDSGHPLHLVIIDNDEQFTPASVRQNGKSILFINNAIHAGEPCGIEASMLFTRDLLTQPQYQSLLDKVTIVIIPVYNIGGALNRNSTTRANQNGPMEYGFRANAKNLDLNRDFIKCDSKNAQTFNQLFTYWQPDVFIDNHTSNGADYQYTLTLIETQHNKLDPHLAQYLRQKLSPTLYNNMEKKGWEMTPYVYARTTPDEGIMGFLDLPRYASGYAALFNTISFIPETHMLKPFKDRVASVYHFMVTMTQLMYQQQDDLHLAKQQAIQNSMHKTTFDLNWTVDTDKAEQLLFKGYTPKYKKSEISGLDRLYYDHNEPFEKNIPFYNTYKTTTSTQKPKAYIIPQAYSRVIERLQWSGVQLYQLDKDSIFAVEMLKIKAYNTTDYPYESHYLHRNIEVETIDQNRLFHKGDYIVYTNQPCNRFIVESLEPNAPDSFFAWNFFDGILMRKEYFSPYVFEDLAAQFLREHPTIKAELEAKKKEDKEFAKSAYQQLFFVYERSPWAEPDLQLYPIGRIF